MLTRVFKSGKVFDDSEFHQHNKVYNAKAADRLGVVCRCTARSTRRT